MRLAVVFLAGCGSLLDLEPPPMPAPSWRFDEDFELGDLSRWTSTSPVQSANGTFEIAHSGAHGSCCAMHVTVSPPGSGYQYALEQWTQATPMAPPIDSGTIAVRAYVRAVALDPDTRELSIAAGGSNPTAFTSAGLGRTADGESWGFILSDESTASYPRQSQDVVPDALGAWHCVEYDVAVGEDGHLALYMDGALQIDGDATTRASHGWDGVTLGLGFSSGTAASEVYIDDVSVALYSDVSPTAHIGCP
jgi:hypothetical protein